MVLVPAETCATQNTSSNPASRMIRRCIPGIFNSSILLCPMYCPASVRFGAGQVPLACHKEHVRKNGHTLPRSCLSRKCSIALPPGAVLVRGHVCGAAVVLLIPTTMRFRRDMTKSRRKFLTDTSLGFLAATAGTGDAQTTNLPPGSPPAFNTTPAMGPAVSPSTYAEAEKL